MSNGDFPCDKCGACCLRVVDGYGLRHVGGRCEHLQDDFSCAIYETRPDVCRTDKAFEAYVKAGVFKTWAEYVSASQVACTLLKRLKREEYDE